LQCKVDTAKSELERLPAVAQQELRATTDANEFQNRLRLCTFALQYVESLVCREETANCTERRLAGGLGEAAAKLGCLGGGGRKAEWHSALRFGCVFAPWQCYLMTSFHSEKICSRGKCRELFDIGLPRWR
jgi:hypothetical protein